MWAHRAIVTALSASGNTWIDIWGVYKSAGHALPPFNTLHSRYNTFHIPAFFVFFTRSHNKMAPPAAPQGNMKALWYNGVSQRSGRDTIRRDLTRRISPKTSLSRKSLSQRLTMTRFCLEVRKRGFSDASCGKLIVFVSHALRYLRN